MTLNEIIVAALQQLKRGRDSQTIDSYRAAFTQYANMAQQDLSKTFPQVRTDDVHLQDGLFRLDALPRWCMKIQHVLQNGRRVPICAAEETGMIRVDTQADAIVQVRYRFLPKPLEIATDSPELPEELHQCIVSYVVACDRSAGDSSTQGSASIHFQLYNEQKRGLRRIGYGVPEQYGLENIWGKG